MKPAFSVPRVWVAAFAVLLALIALIFGKLAVPLRAEHAPPPVALSAAPSLEAVSNAITELDVARAHAYLSELTSSSDEFTFLRARLAIYVGDCDVAEATLKRVRPGPEVARLAELAASCARATAGARVIENQEAGVWLRLQDATDAALAPYLVDVAVKARDTMRRDLGVDLPRPLRIDVVRDLFSLAAVSGLPVEAAETTGTVAIARWGRVILLSPHATNAGYPWQDTLAHEITHLALARGSRDYAPLWLQEGIAKREEGRWRGARPFDQARNPHDIAREALLAGKSVGVDSIGPSIAMLPTPESAGIAYAEVESFMDYWIETNGNPALSLLLLDLKGQNARDTDAALLSVTGYPLRYWIVRWQKHLLETKSLPQSSAHPSSEAGLVQNVRVGDLCMKQGAVTAASYYFGQALEKSPTRAPVRYRAAAAELRVSGEIAARATLGNLGQVSGLFGAWLGLQSRLLNAEKRQPEAETAWDLALGLDPFGEEAACGGYSALTLGEPAQGAGLALDTLPLPQDPTRRKLCEAARGVHRD
jgi:tetratricopeptide (TPR) repeat protein